MNKKWELNEANDALINKISEEFNVSKLVANIIANKGLTNSDEIEVFLHPRRTDFHDPFMMPDMEKAVDIKDIVTRSAEGSKFIFLIESLRRLRFTRRLQFMEIMMLMELRVALF